MDDAINTLSNLVETLDLKIEDGSLEVSESTESLLENIIKLKKFVETAEKAINAQLKVVAEKNPDLKAYQGDKVRLVFSKRETYKVNEEADDRYCVLTKTPKTEAIKKFVELKGELPKGVTLNVTNTITKTLL